MNDVRSIPRRRLPRSSNRGPPGYRVVVFTVVAGDVLRDAARPPDASTPVVVAVPRRAAGVFIADFKTPPPGFEPATSGSPRLEFTAASTTGTVPPRGTFGTFTGAAVAGTPAAARAAATAAASDRTSSPPPTDTNASPAPTGTIRGGSTAAASAPYAAADAALVAPPAAPPTAAAGGVRLGRAQPVRHVAGVAVGAKSGESVDS